MTNILLRAHVPPRNLRHDFEAGLEFSAFLAQILANAPLWRDTYRLVRVPDGSTERLDAVPGVWHLLVMVEDWCGDAINILPLLAKLVESTRQVVLRIIKRDENLALMDAHLTNGTRSMPVVMVLDESYIERGWWGPRPVALQQWVLGEGLQLEKAERYRYVRAWYARDHGRSIVDEVIETIERAAQQSTARVEPHLPFSAPK